MAARGGLGPRRDSRRRRPPDGTEVRKLVRFSRTNLLCWDSRVDKEDGSNICIHLLRVKCQPVIPREVHGPMVHMCAPCTCSRRARRQHPGNTLRVCSTGPLCQGPTNKNL